MLFSFFWLVLVCLFADEMWSESSCAGRSCDVLYDLEMVVNLDILLSMRSMLTDCDIFSWTNLVEASQGKTCYLNIVNTNAVC